MSDPTGWIPLVLSTIAASGAAAAFITTYGGKSRERRQARSEVLACLQHIEVARLSRPAREGLLFAAADFAELETKCMIAGISRDLPFLYKTACERWSGLKPPQGIEGQEAQEMRALAEFLAALAFIDRAAEMLAETVWHPILSRPLRRKRIERLTVMINEVSGRSYTMSGPDAAHQNWKVMTARAPKQ